MTAAYFGRGTAYVQKGLQVFQRLYSVHGVNTIFFFLVLKANIHHFQNKENADAAIEDFSSIIRLSPDNPDGWIKRAEVMYNQY